MKSNVLLKIRLALEVVCCFAVVKAIGIAATQLESALGADSIWTGVAVYALTIALVALYITKAENKSLAVIGLKRVTGGDALAGLALGAAMFAVQQLPMLAMGMDYSALAAEPDWLNIAAMSIYCIAFVGFGEEIVFRGFLLHKSMELFNSAIAAVALNCLLFYAFHWPPVRFVFGEFFNTTVNTIILSLYLLKSKKKSLAPLIFAHGVYDILTVYLLPAAMYYL